MPDPQPTLAEKRERLLSLLRDGGRVGVAFSGGVDSTVVAQAAFVACGERAVAVTAVSASLAAGERENAEALARRIGIRHRVIETAEFENVAYVQNAPDRCYHCKTELYSRLEALADELGIDVLVNGANLDDLGDYRPGLQAATEHRVRSPLVEAGMNKSDVRALAHEWGLPVWDKPASPCLSSRVAYGIEVTPERLERVDRAEQALRAICGLAELRVRHEANNLARIEVRLDDLPRLLQGDARQKIAERLHELGFKFVTVDLDGFRSGSMNAALPLVEISLPRRN